MKKLFGPGSQNATLFVLAIIGSLILVNVLFLRTFWRLDLTHDKAFTLAEASRETMAKLEDPVTITAYFTQDMPPPLSADARYVRDLLSEFRAASKGKLSFEFIDPAAQETEQDKELRKEVKRDIFGRQFREPTSIERELESLGIRAREVQVVEQDQVQVKRVYMALLIKHRENKEVLDPVQVRTLEYELTSRVRKLTRAKTPVIGVLQGHEAPKLDEKLRRLKAVLSETYSVRPVDLTGKEAVDEDVDSLWVIGPKTALAAGELKAIDQFLMKGKSVAFFVDSVQVDPATIETADTEHGLLPLLSTYGVTLEDKLVADVQCGQAVVRESRGMFEMRTPVPYPFMPLLLKLERESPVSAGMRGVVLPFVSPVNAQPGEGRQVAVLAKSSPKSWLEQKPFNVDVRRNWGAENPTFAGPYNLMVQVSGKLKSHFAAEANSGTSQATPLLAESAGESRLIVIGGSAFLWDDFMGDGSPNPVLALNVADWLALDPAMVSIRNRGMPDAPLRTQQLSETTKNAVKFGNSLGLPLLLGAYGVVRWRRREARRRTAHLRTGEPR